MVLGTHNTQLVQDHLLSFAICQSAVPISTWLWHSNQSEWLWINILFSLPVVLIGYFYSHVSYLFNSCSQITCLIFSPSFLCTCCLLLHFLSLPMVSLVLGLCCACLGTGYGIVFACLRFSRIGCTRFNFCTLRAWTYLISNINYWAFESRTVP